MEQKKSWIIRETFDGVKYHDVQTCASLDEVDAWVGKQQSREERSIRVVECVVSEMVIGVQTIPAHVPNLEEIAQEIIGWSDGSYNVEWGEDFDALEFGDRARVEAMVWEEIASCDGCGWHFRVDSIEEHVDSGDMLCYKCAEDRENESEEDESDED